MKPAWTSVVTHGDGGAAFTKARAVSAGDCRSWRASCIAIGDEKSPCCACLGRSSEIIDGGCCGATFASMLVSSSVMCALISVDMRGRKAAYYRRLNYRSGSTEWAKATNAPSAARSSRDRTARPGRARGRRRRRNPPECGRLELDRIHVQVPAHAVRGQPVEDLAPLRKERLQPRSRARLQQRLRPFHSG